MTHRFFAPVVLAALVVPGMAFAQFSDSTNFLKAVRDVDGAKVEEILKKSGGNLAILNTRDPATRETALHIVTKRRDALYLNYLLAQKADPNLADGTGATPLYLAAQLGWAEGIQLLIARRATVDAIGPLGQTPLARAVLNNDIASVRLLLAAGANPNRQDVSGRSPKDLAMRDSRTGAILKEILAAKPVVRGEIAGPR